MTSSGQQWQFHIANDMLVVKNGNFTLLMTSSGQRMAISHIVMTSSGHEWQFHTATDI